MSDTHPTMQRIFNLTGLGPSELADKLNVSPQAITNWSRRGISKGGAIDVSKIFGISVDTILTGTVTDTTKQDLQSKINDITRGRVSSEGKESLPNLEMVRFQNDKKGKLPVISWVAAGSWSEVIPVEGDDVLDWIPKPDHLSDRCFGLIVRGRSMWPEFKPNEIIYIDVDVTPWELIDGELVVIHCEDDKSATFKQLIIGETHEDMYLKPLNPDWPDQKMMPMGDCQLVGVVDSKYTRYRRRR